MHQGFGAMDAQRDALDTRVLRVENLYLHRTMQGMRESSQPEQRKRVRRRVMQDIGSSCGRGTEITATTDTQPMVQGNDGGSIDRVVSGGHTSISCSVPADGVVGNAVGYRVYISDRTLQNIWDEFEVGLNGQPSLNDLNRKFGSTWRHRSDHKNHNKLLNVYNLMKRYCHVSGKSLGDLHESLMTEKDLNTVNKVLRASRARLGTFLEKLGYSWE